jgi:hypothetical protein
MILRIPNDGRPLTFIPNYSGYSADDTIPTGPEKNSPDSGGWFTPFIMGIVTATLGPPVLNWAIGVHKSYRK